MPIEKVKVEHKFGIISQSQRILLEDRLERKAKTPGPAATYSRKRNLYEVSEDFVSKFNDSNVEDQDMLVAAATKMLTRAKRRAGIKDGGLGNHVDLPKAWAELTMLAQLNSKELQEECLEVLLTSLSQAPILQSHIPSLFFLAKTILHWLKRTGLNQPFLRTGEIKLTKMGHLVFLRLYHFHMLNQLQQDYIIEKQSLLGYLSGVSEQQYVYRYFPGALLSLRFITEVGYLICKGVQASPIKSQKSQSNEQPESSNQEGDDSREESSDATLGIKAKSQKYFGMEKITEEEVIEPSYSPTPIRSLTTTESIHETTATLWHALDVWRSTNHKGIGFHKALRGLSVCATGIPSESWLDVSCAFLALSDAATSSLKVLQMFQALAAGVFPKPLSIAEAHAQHLHLCDECHSTYVGETSHMTGSKAEDGGIPSGSDFLSVGPTPSFVKGLREFARLGFKDENSEDLSESNETESLRSRDDKHETSSEASFADVSSVESDYITRRKSSKLRMSSKHRLAHKGHGMGNQSSSDEDEEMTSKAKIDIVNQNDTRKKRLGTGVRFQTDEPTADDEGMGEESWSHVKQENLEREHTKGSLLSGQTRGSTVTIPLADEDQTTTKTATSVLTDVPGIHGWPWELAFLYAEAMTSVCLHGNSAVIQKVALLGNEAYNKPRIFSKKTRETLSNGMGLADLVKFELPVNKDTTGDWSWRVRFSAMLGLVRVSRLGSGDSTKDGMRGAAWNLLVRHHSLERDTRVLEALKLAKVEADLDNKTCPQSPHINTLQTHIAKSLSAELLPRLPLIVTVQDAATNRRASKLTRHSTKRVQIEQTRPSLRQEILLTTAAYEPPEGYGSRMNSQLMAVIEDQWRKQLHLEQELEDGERRKREEEKIMRTGKTATADDNEVGTN